MHAYQKETPAAMEPSVMKKMMFAIFYHVPMEFVTKGKTVIRAPKIVLVVRGVVHVMPVSRVNVMVFAIQRKKPRHVRTAHKAGAVVTASVKETRIAIIVSWTAACHLSVAMGTAILVRMDVTAPKTATLRHQLKLIAPTV
jgi:hypothetical protein